MIFAILSASAAVLSLGQDRGSGYQGFYELVAALMAVGAAISFVTGA